jgi:hypothetical protein
MSADARKLERIQRKLYALCSCLFFLHARYWYANALQLIKRHTLSERKHNHDIVSLLSASRCKILLFHSARTVGLGYAIQNVRHLYTVCVCVGCPRKTSPSVETPPAAYVCKHVIALIF